jgi:ubiquinone/menaquinone biosynthesis C-methylase UbiE
VREITDQEYREFVKGHNEITVDGSRVKLIRGSQIKLYEPKDFTLEKTTVWSFEHRGNWATHRGNYRGNWAPQIPRNLILRYSQPGDTILDQMVGSGTTLIECRLLGRNGIGVDINSDALMVAYNRLDFTYVATKEGTVTAQKLYLGDARHLDLITDASIDLIATHPPYANIIPYSKERENGDLSRVHSIDEFVNEMRGVAKECFRILKPGKHCAILIGDTHKHKHYVPIAFRVLEIFLAEGFILREDVIKQQWHTQTMRGRWKESYNHDFLLTYHEHLFVFRKPDVNENASKFKDSMNWKCSEEAHGAKT